MGPLFRMMSAGAPITGSVVVVNGHSIMSGYGNTPGHSITAEMCAIRGWTEINNAVPSTDIDYMLNNMHLFPDFIEGYHRYYFIGADVNDAGFKTSTPETYADKMLDLLTQIHAKGVPKRQMKALTRFYVSPTVEQWNDYPVSPPYATQAEYFAICDAGQAVRDAFGIQSIDLYDIQEFNNVAGGIYNGDAGLDAFLRHPIDQVTPTLGAYVAARLR